MNHYPFSPLSLQPSSAFSPPPVQQKINHYPRTTIHNLPFEVLALILEYHQKDSPPLLRFALVHTSWSGPALDLLYRDIEISKRSHAVRLARGIVRSRVEKAKCLWIFGFDWVPQIEVILRACVGLKELHLGTFLLKVPLNILHYPSFQSEILSPIIAGQVLALAFFGIQTFKY